MDQIKRNEGQDEKMLNKGIDTNETENHQSDNNSDDGNKSDTTNADNKQLRSLSFIAPDLYQRIQNTISLQQILLEINEFEIEESVESIEALNFFSSSRNFSILIRNIVFMSIFRPLFIDQFSNLIKGIFNKLETIEKLNENGHPINSKLNDYHNITLCEIFHYIFISDEVNCFNSFLHLTFHLYDKNFFTAVEIVDTIRKHFKKYILSRGPISSLFAMFAPEIDTIDHETYENIYQYIQIWNSDNMFNKSASYFFSKFEYYKENDYFQLKILRKELSCNFEYFDIFINDDIERLRIISSNPQFEIDKNIESPFLSPFYFLVNDYSLLSCAASFGAVECFKYLIQNGANYHNKKSTTQVAQYAMIGGSIEIIRICEQFNMNFEGTLQSSATFFRNEIFEYLFETRDKNLNEVSPTKAIVILQAATSNNMELMLNCIEMNCDVNQKDEYEMNCIKKTAFFGLSQMTELLLSMPEIQLNQGELGFAAQNGHYDTASLIIEKSKLKETVFDINFAGVSGKPALFDAIIHSHFNCMDLIYKNGGDANFITNENYCISHFVASQNDIEIFEYMKDKIHFDINSKTKMFFTPLILCVMNMSADMLNYLLKNYKNDVESLNLFFSMKLAAFKENTYIIKHFLDVDDYKDFIIQICNQSSNDKLIKFIESYIK